MHLGGIFCSKPQITHLIQPSEVFIQCLFCLCFSPPKELSYIIIVLFYFFSFTQQCLKMLVISHSFRSHFRLFFFFFYWNVFINCNMPVNVVQHFSITDRGTAMCVAIHLKYVFFFDNNKI